MHAGQQTIDLNVDIGEGFEHDVDLLEFATSVNVACGWHAGDAVTMCWVAKEAIVRGIAIGAHPGFPDRENFGRVEMDIPPQAVYAGVLYQVGALAAVVNCSGGRLVHVKPHGALYNQAEKDTDLALAIVHAVRDLDAGLAIFGLAGGQLVHVARQAGLSAIDEAFADRMYTLEGKLLPRSALNAVLKCGAMACDQAISMVRDGLVRACDGTWIAIRPQTLCLHGDGAHAVAFARRIRSALAEANVTVAPV